MKTALLLIDIQNDYFINGSNPLVGSEEAVVKAGLIIEKFRKIGMPVIHVQHIALNPAATFLNLELLVQKFIKKYNHSRKK